MGGFAGLFQRMWTVASDLIGKTTTTSDSTWYRLWREDRLRGAEVAVRRYRRRSSGSSISDASCSIFAAAGPLGRIVPDIRASETRRELDIFIVNVPASAVHTIFGSGSDC